MNTDDPNIITSNGAFIVYHKIMHGRLHVLAQFSARRDPNRWELTGGGLDYGIHQTLLDTVIDESGQEIGVRPSKQDCKLVGILQQLCKSEKAPGKIIVGMVLVYACPAFFGLDDLTFQADEVADAKWWSIEDAIRAENVMLLASRRMLAIFYNCFRVIGDSNRIVHTGDLSKAVKVRLKTEGYSFSDYVV